MVSKQRKTICLLGLLVLVLAATSLRIRDIPSMSISHPELFVPNIPLRDGVSIPGPRESLFSTVAATLKWDTHPPGYYSVMWFITELFGTSEWALRLPSAAAGVAAVGLLIWIGYLTANPAAGWVAGVLLTLHGLHIFWSQVARMYSLTVLAALLSTALLLYLRRSERTHPVLELLYVAVVLLGVSFHLFFWAVVAVHLVWSLLDGLSHSERLPRLLALSLLAICVSLPLLAFSAYQSGNAVAPLSSDLFRYGKELLAMGLLLPMDGIDAYHTADPSRVFFVPTALFKTGLTLLGLWFFARGLRPSQLATRTSRTRADRLLSSLLPVTLLSTALIYCFVAAAYHLVEPEPLPTIRLTIILGLAPFLVLLVAHVLALNWTRIETSWKSSGLRSRIDKYNDLPALMAVAPFLILATVALMVRPILTQRGLLFLAPFVLLVLARGLVRAKRRGLMLSCAAIVLSPAYLVSLHVFSDIQLDPVNHRKLASLVRQDLEKNDLVFLNQRWDVSPILYYLSPRDLDVEAHNLLEVAGENPTRRIWIFSFYGDLDTADRLQDFAPLELGYRRVHQKSVVLAQASCYAPPELFRERSDRER